jgi:hypothetical protein
MSLDNTLIERGKNAAAGRIAGRMSAQFLMGPAAMGGATNQLRVCHPEIEG